VAVHFTIDVARRLVVTTFEGATPVSEIFELSSRIRAHPDFDPDFSEIIDCTRITHSDMSPDTIRSLSRGEQIFNRSSKHVIVAPADHIFGLARMGQAYAEQTMPNVMVVRTMADALKLLSS
jgi:hypothetical protein